MLTHLIALGALTTALGLIAFTTWLIVAVCRKRRHKEPAVSGDLGIEGRLYRDCRCCGRVVIDGVWFEKMPVLTQRAFEYMGSTTCPICFSDARKRLVKCDKLNADDFQGGRIAHGVKHVE